MTSIVLLLKPTQIKRPHPYSYCHAKHQYGVMTSWVGFQKVVMTFNHHAIINSVYIQSAGSLPVLYRFNNTTL